MARRGETSEQRRERRRVSLERRAAQALLDWQVAFECQQLQLAAVPVDPSVGSSGKPILRLKKRVEQCGGEPTSGFTAVNEVRDV